MNDRQARARQRMMGFVATIFVVACAPPLQPSMASSSIPGSQKASHPRMRSTSLSNRRYRMKMRYLVVAAIITLAALILVLGTHPFGKSPDDIQRQVTPKDIGKTN
jgi:hypothetical protein